ncbi:MAG: hypothetical protein U1E52_10120 [Geminicoccaceae bacterium]
MRRLLGLGTAGAFAGLAACHAPSPPPAAVVDGDAVPADVVDVRTMGRWRTAGGSGTFRVVTREGGLERVQTSVAVEWLTSGLADVTPELVAAREIELLGDLGPIAVVSIDRRERPGEIEIDVAVRNQLSGEKGNVHAVAAGPGDLRAEYVTTH